MISQKLIQLVKDAPVAVEKRFWFDTLLRPLVAAMPNLQNQVHDLSAIAKLKKLQHFDFSHKQIRDLTVLATLPKLFSIRLTNNPVDSSTCLDKRASAGEGGES